MEDRQTNNHLYLHTGKHGTASNKEGLQAGGSIKQEDKMGNQNISMCNRKPKGGGYDWECKENACGTRKAKTGCDRNALNETEEGNRTG